MLNSMHSPLKWVFLFAFLFLLLVKISSGLELGVSPPKLTFDLAEGEEQCQQIKLISSDRTFFIVDDYWINESRIIRDVSYYNKSSGVFEVRKVMYCVK